MFSPSGKTEKFKKILYLIMIPVFVFCLFVTGKRGPFIAAVLGLLFYFYLGFVKRISPKFRIISMIVLAVIISAFYFYGDLLPHIFAYSPMAIMEGQSTTIRLELYSLSRELFFQNPILGVGTGGFSQLSGSGGYPHNIFLEILSENGLVGIMIFLAFISLITIYGTKLIALFTSYSTEFRQKIALMVLAIALALFVGRQFSYGLTMHKDLLVFFALVVNLYVYRGADINCMPKGVYNFRLK